MCVYLSGWMPLDPKFSKTLTMATVVKSKHAFSK